MQEESENSEPVWYVFPPAVLAPATLTVLAVGLGFFLSWWSLAAIPFIWLGSVCAAPNVNLVDGCLAWVALGLGLALMYRFAPFGIAMSVGTAFGLFPERVGKNRSYAPGNRWQFSRVK